MKEREKLSSSLCLININLKMSSMSGYECEVDAKRFDMRFDLISEKSLSSVQAEPVSCYFRYCQPTKNTSSLSLSLSLSLPLMNLSPSDVL